MPVIVTDMQLHTPSVVTMMTANYATGLESALNALRNCNLINAIQRKRSGSDSCFNVRLVAFITAESMQASLNKAVVAGRVAATTADSCSGLDFQRLNLTVNRPWTCRAS